LLRAIVFDFDGVIANSEPLHYRAFHEVLADVGVELSEAEYYAEYLGYDDRNAFTHLATNRGLAWTKDRIGELIATKAVRMELLEADVSLLFPGAAAAIRRAAAAVPVAIASGALGEEIRRILERERLTSYFRAIVAAEDSTASKPAPEPYRRAVTLLAGSADRLQPAECVAIEDSPWGLQSARAAGLRTVAVAHTYEAAALEADLVIASLDELDIAALQRLCAD
jgi:beta-phosphoglucomutase